MNYCSLNAIKWNKIINLDQYFVVFSVFCRSSHRFAVIKRKIENRKNKSIVINNMMMADNLEVIFISWPHYLVYSPLHNIRTPLERSISSHPRSSLWIFDRKRWVEKLTQCMIVRGAHNWLLIINLRTKNERSRPMWDLLCYSRRNTIFE